MFFEMIFLISLKIFSFSINIKSLMGAQVLDVGDVRLYILYYCTFFDKDLNRRFRRFSRILK